MSVPNLEVPGKGGRRCHDINSKLLLREEDDKESMFSQFSLRVFDKTWSPGSHGSGVVNFLVRAWSTTICIL
jgi:hypothetical protein